MITLDIIDWREMSQSPEIAKIVIDTPVEEELKDGFLAYSLSVIHSRAIPDIRDGLKPVQRRILYGMHKQRVKSDGPYRKSARVVGDVMGRYHPHGDAAIYDALVRLGQPFSMRLTLVDPHGNFGSLDDPPAASRYTECRLSGAAEDLLSNLDEDTVDFRPNYDGEETEPVYLPAAFPNLLVNGAAGIAVGMATNMAPHNLGEVVSAAKLVLNNPDVTLQEIMSVLPGPDFPSGGEIVGSEGILSAYETGKGSVRLRAKNEITHTGKRHSITITELPYQVGPERVLAKIGDLVRSGRIDTISDVRDLSDRNGLKIVIDIKNGLDPKAVLAQLCKLSPIEETFATNAIVLVDGQPQCLGVIELLQHYISHRLDVVVRRSKFRLNKAETRAHLVEGLVIALGNIDKVIAIIRGAKDTAAAKKKLCKDLKLSEAQAEHILDMQLRRLTRLEADKLNEELAALKEQIADLKDLIGSPERQRSTVEAELDEVAAKHITERRTRILGADPLDGVSISTEVSDEPAEITFTGSGLIARTPADGWKGKLGKDDLLVSRVDTRTTGTVLAVTGTGKAAKIRVADVPEVAGRNRGVDILSLSRMTGENIINVLPEGNEDVALVLVTAYGVIKRLTAEEVNKARDGSTLITLSDGDSVIGAAWAPDSAEIMMVSSDAQLLRTPLGKIRPQGRTAGGVAGMKLKPDAQIVGIGVLSNTDDIVVLASDNGKAKLTAASEYPAKGRGTGGVRAMNMKTGQTVSAVWIGPLQTLAGKIGDDVTKLSPAEGKRDGAGGNIGGIITQIGAAR